MRWASHRTRNEDEWSMRRAEIRPFLGKHVSGSISQAGIEYNSKIGCYIGNCIWRMGKKPKYRRSAESNEHICISGTQT